MGNNDLRARRRMTEKGLSQSRPHSETDITNESTNFEVDCIPEENLVTVLRATTSPEEVAREGTSRSDLSIQSSRVDADHGAQSMDVSKVPDSDDFRAKASSISEGNTEALMEMAYQKQQHIIASIEVNQRLGSQGYYQIVHDAQMRDLASFVPPTNGSSLFECGMVDQGAKIDDREDSSPLVLPSILPFRAGNSREHSTEDYEDVIGTSSAAEPVEHLEGLGNTKASEKVKNQSPGNTTLDKSGNRSPKTRPRIEAKFVVSADLAFQEAFAKDRRGLPDMDKILILPPDARLPPGVIYGSSIPIPPNFRSGYLIDTYDDLAFHDQVTLDLMSWRQEEDCSPQSVVDHSSIDRVDRAEKRELRFCHVYAGKIQTPVDFSKSCSVTYVFETPASEISEWTTTTESDAESCD